MPDAKLVARLAGQVARNAAAVFLRGLLQVAYWLFLAPFILNHLGARVFGLWSLIYVIYSYVALLDFGISGATSKFVAETDPAADPASCRLWISSGFVGLSVAALAGGLVLWLPVLIGWPANFGAIAQGGLIPAVWLLLISSLWANLISYAISGLQRQDVAVGMNAAVIVGGALAVWLLLAMRDGLLSVIWVSIAGNLVTIPWGMAILRRRLGGRVWQKPSIAAIRRLFRFGFWLQIYALVGLFYLFAGKAWIGATLSLSLVAVYEIGLRLVTLLRQGISMISSSLMPASARAYGELGAAATARIYELSMLGTAFIAAPLFVALALWAVPIVAVWVGPGHEASAMVMRLLIPGFFLATFAALTWFFLVGIGATKVGAVFSLVEAGLGMVLTVWWSRAWGLNGIAAAVSIPAVLSLAGYVWLLRLKLPISVAQIACRGLLVPVAICSILGGLALKFLPHASPWQLAMSASIFVVTSYGTLYLSPMFGRNYRRQLRQVIAHAPLSRFA
ncbi:MAG TPA: oligosaccharide flippase family protein [Terriglobales bacterium]|nr:oligosaccharide flippase family protein [Terriglobales bacterium]